MKRRVVITGLGAISPIGNNINELWNSIKEGKCGIDYIKSYDTSNQEVKVAGEVKDLDVTKFIAKRDARKLDKFVQYAMICSDEAMATSGLNMEEEDADRCGVILATGIGGINTIEKEYQKGQKKGFDRVSPYYIPMSICNMAAGNVSIRHGFKGISECTVTACASGTNAIGDAFRQVRDGYCDIMIAGGAESSITPLSVGGFTSLKALANSNDPQRASIPFDKERSGFVMSEGAGILVLEEYEHAKKRNAKIYAEFVGYAANCDANHITAPLEDGSGAAKCMTMALNDANIEANAVDYINAHGTSTPLNDKGETKAIKLAFKEHAKELMVSSTKSMTGHLLGASGGIEAVISALSIYNGFVPPTVNYKVPDEECDLDIVPNEGREKEINYAISNSLGFGGHNATIVLKKYSEEV